MNCEKQCGICKYVKLRNGYYGVKKLTCSLKKCDVGESDMCLQFIQDDEKVLLRAGFRQRGYGSTNTCVSCVHRKKAHENAKIYYICNINSVAFWSGFSPMDFICNNYEDGGLNTFEDYISDLLTDTTWY